MMSDRVTRGLRGPVKSCTEESTFLPMAEAGASSSEVHFERTTEYDSDGRIVVTRSRNSDGSQWVTRYEYTASGQLLKTGSGIEGKALTETYYFYDQGGRLQKIATDGKDEAPLTFRYDERGRKTKIETSRAEDYRPNMASGGSPFEAADRAPNLPGGGSATTTYDEQDRPTEVQVRDASGELVSHALRAYDALGHVIEEKQILDNPVNMFPPEAQAKMLAESGLSADQLRQEIGAQLRNLMAGQAEMYSVRYRYDSGGHPIHATRRIFNDEEEIETTYNEHGDEESEITRNMRLGGAANDATPAASYSEVRSSYQYDQYGNWTEKAISYRPSPGAAFQSSTVIKRSLTYY